MVQDQFWKIASLNPIFDPFLVPQHPIFKTFWGSPWAKVRHHGLKIG